MRPLLLLAALAVAGCATTALPAAPADPLALGRPADRLLERPDLQAVVDLQVLRDADGLIAALASPDSAVRARAAFALGSVQAEAALPALRRLLDDPVPAVRADAAFAIGQTADDAFGVPLVVSLRQEATPAVQAELLEALGKTGDAADLAAVLEVALPARLESVRMLALARFGLRDVTSPAWADALARGLLAADPLVRQRAAYAFTRAPVAAYADHADALRAAFDSLADDPARTSLTRALGRLDDAADAPRFAAALAADPNWRTRVQAARALEGVDAPGARGALVRAVDDPNPHVSQAAAAGLARAATPGAVDRALAVVREGRRPWPVEAALLPLLAPGHPDAVLAWADRQADPFAQAAALRALGGATDADAADRLFAAAASDDPRLATAALGALGDRWEAGADDAGPYFAAFAAAVRRADLATTAAAAPLLADSAFWALGAGAVLREAYAALDPATDLEPMAALVASIGRVRDGDEIPFLVGVALEGPSGLRRAAQDALNDRLEEGIEVETPDGGTPATTAIDWAHLARVGPRPRLVLETDRGTVVLALDAEAAPQTVQRITTTAAQGLYDGVPFHRVVSDFVVQGGDHVRRDGYGGPPTAIRSEFTRLRYGTGTLGMASAGKDTEGSQFFVTHSPQPHLDGRYTAFGTVVEGQDVVDRILQGDVVRRARVAR